MSAEMACHVLDLDQLSAEERLVALLLADQADGLDQVTARVAILAAQTSLPTATIERFLRSFAAAGFFKIERVADGDYEITFDSVVLRRCKRAKASSP